MGLGRFLFQVPWLHCGRRRETHFVFVSVAQQVACRQTSRTQLATSPLHARSSARSIDVASLALQHKIVRRGDSVAQAALNDCWLVELLTSSLLWSCVLLVLLQVVSFSLFVFLVAAVDGARGMGTFREGGMEASSERSSLTKTTRERSAMDPKP